MVVEIETRLVRVPSVWVEISGGYSPHVTPTHARTTVLYNRRWNDFPFQGLSSWPTRSVSMSMSVTMSKLEYGWTFGKQEGRLGSHWSRCWWSVEGVLGGRFVEEERGAVEDSTWGLRSETGLSPFLSALCFNSFWVGGRTAPRWHFSTGLFLCRALLKTRRQISYVRSSTGFVVGTRRVKVRVDREGGFGRIGTWCNYLGWRGGDGRIRPQWW